MHISGYIDNIEMFKTDHSERIKILQIQRLIRKVLNIILDPGIEILSESNSVQKSVSVSDEETGSPLTERMRHALNIFSLFPQPFSHHAFIWI